jgi:hypothetical protein
VIVEQKHPNRLGLSHKRHRNGLGSPRLRT